MVKKGAQFADDVVQAGAKTSTQETAKYGAQFADDASLHTENGKWKMAISL